MSFRTTDPLTVLRAYDAPVPPSLELTARLRRRLEAGPAILAGRREARPCLTVRDVDRAAQWYSEAFGAATTSQPPVLSDNNIGHAAVTLGDSEVYLIETAAEPAATEPGVTSVSLMLSVPDLENVLQRIQERGARLEHQAATTATVVDPFGHRWILTGSPAR